MMMVVRCALDMVMVVHRLRWATLEQARLSPIYVCCHTRSCVLAVVMVVVVMVMTATSVRERKHKTQETYW